MTRAILFDIDGTLVDSVDLHAAAWVEAFGRFGKRETHERVRDQIGKGGDQLKPVFFSKEELERIGDELEEYRARLYREKYFPKVKPFSMTRELVEAIRARGLKIGLASSAKEDELTAYEKIADIEGLVEGKTSSDDAERSKPEPDVFQVALARVGVVASEALVVGDTPYDIEAAKRAGIPAVGVRSGGWSVDELRGAGAIAVYRSCSELYYRLDDSPLVSVKRAA